MSLDKAIEHGKEHRKIYHGSKSFDYTCRNHGACEWCKENRLHKHRKEILSKKQEEEEWGDKYGKIYQSRYCF